jgi:hypothetical protein
MKFSNLSRLTISLKRKKRKTKLVSLELNKKTRKDEAKRKKVLLGVFFYVLTPKLLLLEEIYLQMKNVCNANRFTPMKRIFV